MEYTKGEAAVERNRVYEHYRGNRYLVVDIAKDADKDGATFSVIYRALYGHGQLYVSSLERFTATNDAGEPRFRMLDLAEQNPNSNHVDPTSTM